MSLKIKGTTAGSATLEAEDSGGDVIVTFPKEGGRVTTDVIWSTTAIDFTAAANHGYFVDCTASAIAGTLPSSPILGDTIWVVDWKSYAFTNNIILNPNGNNFMGAAGNYTINNNNKNIIIVYSDALWGWLIVAGA